MINSYRNIFGTVVIICLTLFFSCENDINEVRDLSRKKQPVDEAVNVESYLSQGGILKAKLTAPLMRSVENDSPQIEFPKTLKVIFYNDSGKVESNLTARYGIYYQKTNLVYLKDSVVVYNVKKDTLLSDELWWDQDRERIYTNTAVHIRKPDEKIDGTGLQADQNFTWWTITNAKGPISVSDSLLPPAF